MGHMEEKKNNIVRTKKIGMTQIWQDDKVVPVTVLEVTEGDAESLEEGSRVKISGHSKGRGFQGVVKRHGFHGGPASHGQKDRLRAPGSIGATDPARVIPGKKMAGHMGTHRVTVKNMKVIKKEERNIFVKGAVPGANGMDVEVYI